jgi:uncharacterized protein involved in outer membrane biogenesis
MKKLAIGCGVLVVLAGVGVAGLGAYLASQLRTPELQKAILEQARATLGTELRVREMQVSLLSGVKLEGIAVANPAPFGGELLTADAFVLRYRLLPLLAGRVEVERLALEKPALALAMDARGRFNYEKLAAAAPTPVKGAAASGKAASATTPPAGAAPLRVVMKSLAVEDASILMTDHTQARLMAVDDVDFRSAFELAGGLAQGAGEVTIGKASFADVLLVRGVRAPLSLSKEKVTLTPIRGEVAGGVVSGDVKVDLKGGFRFTTDVELTGARVATLLEEAGSAAAVSGTLSAKARFEGQGGLATMRGQGSADVAACRAENSRVLALLASVLQVPELANPDFEACRVEFTQTGSRFATPVVKLTGEAVRLEGSGSLDLETSRLDYQMMLGLSPKLFARVTRPELRAGFVDRDGYLTTAFRLYGTTLEPKTDLLSRIGKAAAADAARKQVDKLLKKKLF